MHTRWSSRTQEPYCEFLKQRLLYCQEACHTNGYPIKQHNRKEIHDLAQRLPKTPELITMRARDLAVAIGLVAKDA